MKSEIEISDEIIKRIRKMAYRFEERYECWGMADDVFGAALEGLVRDPQPTVARILSGAWWDMLDEMARLYGRGKYQVVYLLTLQAMTTIPFLLRLLLWLTWKPVSGYAHSARCKDPECYDTETDLR